MEINDALGSMFLPEELYIHVYQVEISPSREEILHKEVQYKVKLDENPNDRVGDLRILRLAKEIGYHTIIFLTFSLDVERKYVVDTLEVHIKKFNSMVYVNGVSNIIYLVLGVYENVQGWEQIDQTLTTSVNRIQKLQTNKIYLFEFLVFRVGVQIYFAPLENQNYQNIPKYAQIRIVLVDSRGREIKNPPPITDIIQLEIVDEPDESEISTVHIDTTEYLKVSPLITEIRSKNRDK
ncbi:hypothetical protein RF11_02245 [Thelohanellus kitauei]|uniref:Uncharacterized protein n=1 Tax=Thelohanellus kitauei TaxID=669202 RepID=A0A0C2MP50_THEKT|nr:hypothetical protein RF11_02245 [Thelohanellus kitauei]